MSQSPSQDEKVTMLIISLSAITAIWATTSMITLILSSHLANKHLSLEIATQALSSITINTDILSLWTAISLAANVIFLYLAVRVTIIAMKDLVKGKDID